MTKNKEIGQRIKQRRIELKMTQAELGNKLKLNKSTIQRYETGIISSIKLPVLQAIAQQLDVSPDWLALKTAEKGSYRTAVTTEHILSLPNIIPLPKTKKLPLLGAIACGEPILAEENIENYVDVDKDVEAEFALRCKGDSMIDARISSGDIVYIHQQPDVENGEIAAVLIGEEATLKRVYKYPDKQMIVLKPANPNYEDLIYIGEEAQNIRIMGKAVAFFSMV